MSVVRIVLMLALLAGCGAGNHEPDFKAGGALVKCEPTPCGQ